MSDEVDEEDDFESSEDDKPAPKGKQQSKKGPEPQVDLDSMTKRQRMAYLQKHQPQTLAQPKTTAI